ncbi:unnamed protein product, partial [Choristocarpus tenellus]
MSAKYTVVLGAEPAAEVIVALSLNADASTELTVDKSFLTFTTSSWSVPQVVTVSAVDDSDVGGLVDVWLTHFVSSSDPVYAASPDIYPSENITVLVYDNDDAGISLSTSALYIDEGDQATYTVVLNAVPDENVEARREWWH